MSTLDPVFDTPSDSPTTLRGDVQLISLVGIAHWVSHFSQLLLPPLFPWIKEGLGVSYAELGFLMFLFKLFWRQIPERRMRVVSVVILDPLF